MDVNLLIQELGEGWTHAIDPHEQYWGPGERNSYQIFHQDGGSIYVKLDSKTKRWKADVSWQFPGNRPDWIPEDYSSSVSLLYDYRNKDVSTGITVAGHTTEVKLAQAIHKRLLPGYLEGYANAVARVKADVDRHIAKKELLARLCDICGVTPNLRVTEEARFYPRVNGVSVTNGIYYGIRIRHDAQTVELKLDGISSQSAEHILVLLMSGQL